MKIDFANVKDAYDDLYEISVNQISILDEMAQAVGNFTGLSDFSGDAADNIKAYYSEMHQTVISTLKVLVADLTVTFQHCNDDFGPSVDNGSTPVLDSEYIQSKITEENTLKGDIDAAESNLESIRNEVSDIFTPSATFYRSNINNGCTANIDMATKIRQSLLDFNDAHLADMDEIIAAIDNLGQALNYMKSVGSADLGTKYVSGIALEEDWYGKMHDYQLNAGEKAEKNGWEVAGDIFTAYTQYRTLKSLIEKGADLGMSLDDLDALYRMGISFTLVQEGDQVLFKLTSEVLDVAQLQKVFKNESGHMLKYSKIREMIEGGLLIVDKDGNYINKKTAEILKEATGFKLAFEGADEASDAARTAAGVSNASKWIDGVGWVISGVSNTYDNVYNPITGQWEPTVENISDTAIETGIDIGVDLGITAAAAAIGTAICPGPGTAVGAVVGLGVSFVLSVATSIEWGEPPKSVVDHVKDGVTDAWDGACEWFSKTFF